MKRKVHGNTGVRKSRRHRQRIAEGVRAHWARVHALSAAPVSQPQPQDQPTASEESVP